MGSRCRKRKSSSRRNSSNNRLRVSQQRHGSIVPERRTLPRWKKACVGGTITLVFFVALELLLAASGIKPVLRSEDPYVGFSGMIPLFIEQTDYDHQTYYTTAPIKLPWFNRQRFPKLKGPETYRIFCLGESTTYGHPYADSTSNCGWLREFLRAADKTRTWEVINAGGISYASYRLAMLTEELIQYQPDLFIVYVGHNEFLEKRTYASMAALPPIVRNAGTMLSRTRTYSVLRQLVHGTHSSAKSTESSSDDLHPEVAPILDHSFGLELYTRDDKFQKHVVDHYRFNLNRIVELARSVGAKVLFVTPASSLRDCAPFKSEHDAELSEAQKDRCMSIYDRACQHLAANRFEEALALADELEAVDGRYAHFHYLRAKVLDGLKRYGEAKAEYLRAIDEDICPLRAVTAIRDTVAEVASEQNVPLVDFIEVVEQQSPQGIPGNNIFLDHVHPTIEGNRLLGLALFDRLKSEDIVHPESDWGQAAMDAVKRDVEAQIDPHENGVALRNLAMLLEWAGKADEAAKLAEQALALIPDDTEARLQVGNALVRAGQLTEAADQFQRLVQQEPKNARAHHCLGKIYVEQGNLSLAKSHLETAIRIRPTYAIAHNSLGKVLHQTGDLAEAAASFQRAIQFIPDFAEAHYNLGNLLLQQQDFGRAAASFQRCLEVVPNYQDAVLQRQRAIDLQGNRSASSEH